MTNNHKNNRHGNIRKKRKLRRGSFLPKRKDDICPFSLTIYKDENGYYAHSKYCYQFHQFHTGRGHIRIHCKLLHADKTQLLKDSDEACSLSSIARNVLYVRHCRRTKITSLHSNRQMLQIGKALREKERCKKSKDGDIQFGGIWYHMICYYIISYYMICHDIL